MALLTRVAAHPDALVGLLCEQLATTPGDLFSPEVTAVPTRGIERWLTQRIAVDLEARGVGDGICANVEFPSPHGLIHDILAAVPELAASAKGWDGPALAGHVVAGIDSHLSDRWMRLLARHLAVPHAEAGLNRWAAGQKIARLYRRYARRRPAMIRAWADGNDVGSDGEPLPEQDRWQPRLWRLVRDQIGVPSFPELLPGALDPIRSGAVDPDLPGRVAVYGLTAVDPLDLQVLAAVSEQRDVYLYLLHPSPRLWEATATALGAPLGVLDRLADPTTGLARHPLLAAWAGESRELQVVHAAHGLDPVGVPISAEASDTLLGGLQDDIRHNRAPGLDPARAGSVAAGADRSIQVHVCHGARRQVEVLRDAICHILVADPTLEPRDVVIMTPDLASFAPLLEAGFPRGEAAGTDAVPDLRLRIADRSPAATNPLVRFAATLLEIGGSRVEAGVVRELVSRPVVQDRFGFDVATAGDIVGVIDDTHVRWGVDGTHREQWGAGTSDDGTWRRALDRALTGVFYSDSDVRVVDDTVPLGGVEGHEAVPVGLLAQILDRLAALHHLLRRPRAMSEWGPAIAVATRLLAAPAWGEEWQWNHLERLLGETFPPPPPGGADPDLTLAEARHAIAGWADDHPSPLHFRTGDVTVCTLAPMRSVPYRVVCLLGMDDERFPRSSRDDGDDLLLRHEVVGDFDRSAQDRQLLLDALMAAGDHLVVTYSGRDELTNAEYPPAVPIAELTDVVADMVGADAAASVVTTHPLQSFSQANFTPGRLGVAGPWAFDAAQLAGARAMLQRGAAATPTPVVWSRVEPAADLQLADLVSFLHHPARSFLRSRLRFTIPEPGAIPNDTLPTDLDPLAEWSIADRLLAGLANGHPVDALVVRERSTGALPPGDLGGDGLERVVERASRLWDAAQERGYDPHAQAVWSGVVALGDRRVEGSVEADAGRSQLVTVTPSRLKARQRLKAFVELVFLTALEPEIEWQAILVGRHDRFSSHLAVTVGPIRGRTPHERQERAAGLLEDLVDLHDEGHHRPIPLPCNTAYAWQRALGTKERSRARYEARKIWETDRFNPENGDPAHVMALPGMADIDALLAAGLDDYCLRLWGPILPLCREAKL